MTWALTKPAPKVPINVEIGPDRSFCWTGATSPSSSGSRTRSAAPSTTSPSPSPPARCARWLQDRGVDADGLELQALVPVSVRTENEHGELGNRLTAMRGAAPGRHRRPGRAPAHGRAGDGQLKASKQPLGAEAIWGLNDWFRDFAPPLLLGPTAAINFSTRLFNMLVTNFPGPQIPFYVLGRELVGVYPVGFLARDHALAIAIFSYNGSINFGLLADRDTVADLETIAAYMEDSVQELREAAPDSLQPQWQRAGGR